MKAIVYDKFGGSDLLHLEDLPVPDPEPDEVQVRLFYAGVNPVDWKIREGFLKDMFGYEFPVIPGFDGAGVVSAVGVDVRGFQVGNEVYANFTKPVIKNGTYCEFVTMPESKVAFKPKNATLLEAAAFPVASLTAWKALIEFANLQKGQTLLIYAAAGGVGSMAVQIAKWKQAEVIALTSEKNHLYVKSLGADHVIDYTKGDVKKAVLEKFSHGIDVVLDAVGGQTGAEAIELVKKDGVLVSIVDFQMERFMNRGIKAGSIFISADKKMLEEITFLIENNFLKAPKITEFPLEKAKEASDLVQGGHVAGKVVLKI